MLKLNKSKRILRKTKKKKLSLIITDTNLFIFIRSKAQNFILFHLFKEKVWKKTDFKKNFQESCHKNIHLSLSSGFYFQTKI